MEGHAFTRATNFITHNPILSGLPHGLIVGRSTKDTVLIPQKGY
jgi:hypothetical protein